MLTQSIEGDGSDDYARQLVEVLKDGLEALGVVRFSVYDDSSKSHNGYAVDIVLRDGRSYQIGISHGDDLYPLQRESENQVGWAEGVFRIVGELVHDAPDIALRYEAERVKALAELEFLTGKLAEVEADRRATVKRARQFGVSWADIGNAVGLTAQGAYQRWAKDK